MSLLRRQKATRRDGNGHDRGMKNVAYTPSKNDTSWRKRMRSRHEKRRLYVVKNATRRNGNGHDRGMKNIAITPPNSYTS